MRVPLDGQGTTPRHGVSPDLGAGVSPYSAQPATCADGSRWADLVSLLVAPDTPARLLAPTSQDNTPRPIGEGAADALLLEAARLGGLAGVAPVRPDTRAVDQTVW